MHGEKNIGKDNKHNSIHLARKCAWYSSLDITCFSKLTVFPKLNVQALNCELQETDNVHRQMDKWNFVPNGGYCLYTSSFWTATYFSQCLLPWPTEFFPRKEPFKVQNGRFHANKTALIRMKNVFFQISSKQFLLCICLWSKIEASHLWSNLWL